MVWVYTLACKAIVRNLTGFYLDFSDKELIMKLTSYKSSSFYVKEKNTMLFAPKEKAQGLVEYALILVLVAVVVIVILALLGPAIGAIFSNIVESI
jgi:pilus assembly protein Flp/PilA